MRALRRTHSRDKHLLAASPMSAEMLTLPERFWAKVNKTETCWLWTGAHTPLGYGRFSVGQHRLVCAHRWAYEAVLGPIPEGLVIDHLCRVPACVNPSHLEPVTTRINNLRGIGYTAQRAAQTQCVNGHDFTVENTYVRPNRTRDCRRCRAARMQSYRKLSA